MTRSQPPARVPTLTEVLDRPLVGEPATSISSDAGPPDPPLVAVLDQPIASEADIAEKISLELQAHIDRVLAARLQAALAPILEQTVTRVIEETRRELASTLRDGLARALAQKSPRHRRGS